jgi:acetyl-CoA carboxylase carboxyltransferase component
MAALVMAGSPNARSVPVAAFAWPTAEIGHVDGFSATRPVDAHDDVIDPAETRPRMVKLLSHLPPRAELREKRHPVDSW